MAALKPHKREAEVAALTEQEAQAWALRVRGYTQRAIAKELGCSTGKANGLIKRARATVAKQHDERIYTEAAAARERLDIAITALMPQVEKGDKRAMEVLAKLEKRRAELLGLDAPKKVAVAVQGDINVTGRVDMAVLSDEVLLEMMARADGVVEPKALEHDDG